LETALFKEGIWSKVNDSHEKGLLKR